MSLCLYCYAVLTAFIGFFAKSKVITDVSIDMNACFLHVFCSSGSLFTGCYQGYLNSGSWCCPVCQPYNGQILSSSASSIHALRMLRSHGLGSPQLHVIARSTTLASMLYASPAWW